MFWIEKRVLFDEMPKDEILILTIRKLTLDDYYLLEETKSFRHKHCQKNWNFQDASHSVWLFVSMAEERLSAHQEWSH